MLARDVMVSPVITVGLNATVRDVARTLLDKHISAVPVVDGRGKVAGIITEGDLLHRAEAGTERRYSWWLQAFLSDSAFATDYVKSHAVKVSDIMTRDVVTVAPEAPVHEIAALLENRQIKRVPVVTAQGDLVGIVSRANLLQAIAAARPKLELTLPDAGIRAKIVQLLSKQSWTHASRLNVTVVNGVVDLWGAIDSEAERKALRVAVESVPGVTMVQDRLFHRPPGWE
jgi:CBS domain-containing protein